MKDIGSFVALKYQLPTESNFLRTELGKCHELLNTYPIEVTKSWAWRCAEDVEHLATTSESKEVYRIARLFRDGLATEEELEKAWSAQAVTGHATTAAAGHAATYAAGHATTAAAGHAAVAATYAARSAARVAAPAAHVAYNAEQDKKWNQYRDWLIEELCKWEESAFDIKQQDFVR